MKLQDKAVKSKFNLELRNKFAVQEAVPEEPDVETKWDQFVKTYNQTAKGSTGNKKKETKTMDKSCILE